MPFFIRDLQAAQAEDAGGADIAFFVHLKRRVNQCFQFRAAAFRPFVDALVNQGFGCQQPLIEDQRVLHGKVDAVRAVEAVQADIAFLAADRYVVAVGTQLHKRRDIVHRLSLERHQVILYRAGFGGNFLHQLIAQQVDFFNIGQRHEIAFGILFVLGFINIHLFSFKLLLLSNRLLGLLRYGKTMFVHVFL